MSSLRVVYSKQPDAAGSIGLAPLLPLHLSDQGKMVEVDGLVDSGASVNVLPHHIGLALGAVWDEQRFALTLEGNLGGYEARPLIVTTAIADFEPVRLIFAWSLTDKIPLILGQVNFFQKFNVCFFRSAEAFEITPIMPRTG